MVGIDNQVGELPLGARGNRQGIVSVGDFRHIQCLGIEHHRGLDIAVVVITAGIDDDAPGHHLRILGKP